VSAWNSALRIEVVRLACDMTPELRVVRRIKRFDPLQLGKMLAVLYGCMGLIFVPFFLLATVLPALIPQPAGRPGAPVAFAAMFGVGFAVAAPIFYAVMGFLTGLIGGWVYNLVAKWIGGIEVEVE
jgi:hypothetical protein